MYLEATVTPTVMKALQEVCEARPENPLEFVAYYLLKHNPDKQELNNEGAPIGHFHPQDPAATKKEWEFMGMQDSHNSIKQIS